jgi:hypothetical protein
MLKDWLHPSISFPLLALSSVPPVHLFQIFPRRLHTNASFEIAHNDAGWYMEALKLYKRWMHVIILHNINLMYVFWISFFFSRSLTGCACCWMLISQSWSWLLMPKDCCLISKALSSPRYVLSLWSKWYLSIFVIVCFYCRENKTRWGTQGGMFTSPVVQTGKASVAIINASRFVLELHEGRLCVFIFFIFLTFI